MTDRTRRLSRFYTLGDLLVDTDFPELASQLAPSAVVITNLERLTAILDRIVERFPPTWRVVTGYRDTTLNEACRQKGLPASVDSLHMSGCAVDISPTKPDEDLEAVFEWIRTESKSGLDVHEAVFYPKKRTLHIAVQNPEQPTARRFLVRT